MSDASVQTWERDPEIYWIAGFLEGEGCFGWYGDDRRPESRIDHSGYPLVIASQNFREPLDRLTATFPGPVRMNSITVAGNEHWEYRVTARRAIDIMVAVYPLMSSRRRAVIEECVAKYAEQSVQRIEVFLYCRNGHRLDDDAPRGSTNRGIRRNGHRYCRACCREAAAAKKKAMLV
jgi:hypothetical protein